MKTLLENCILQNGKEGFVAIDGKLISYVGEERPQGCFDSVKKCRGKLVMSGLYNLHTHIPMVSLRGYAEELPLSQWLENKIFPAEDKLTPEIVAAASGLAIAEQLKNGIVSFSDMYFFSDVIARETLESGIKANISRSLVSFDPARGIKGDSRFEEAEELYKSFHNSGDGRIKIDMCLHAEYSNTEKYVREFAGFCNENKMRVQVHLSETEAENEGCFERHKMSPTEFFDSCGLFESQTVCAHCVWLSESDMDLLAKKNVTAVHNPTSNLKLGSGIMKTEEMLARGINITLGTDGAASNNTLDVFAEMRLASLIAKGFARKADALSCGEIIKMATVNGAKAQGRENCGELREGCAADLILVDMEALNNIPSYNINYSLLFSVTSSNVTMTMVDGKILYENGQFTTIDVEKIRKEAKKLFRF